MLIANNIKTYEDFWVMEKDSVAVLMRTIAMAPTKLKEVHGIRVNEILSFIWFLETIDKVVADDPLQWKKEMEKRQKTK